MYMSTFIVIGCTCRLLTLCGYFLDVVTNFLSFLPYNTCKSKADVFFCCIHQAFLHDRIHLIIAQFGLSLSLVQTTVAQRQQCHSFFSRLSILMFKHLDSPALQQLYSPRFQSKYNVLPIQFGFVSYNILPILLGFVSSNVLPTILSCVRPNKLPFLGFGD